MQTTYDIIVIGAGSGGLNVASFMNAIGLRVLLIDKSDAHIGGDCLNTGCVPSKSLIHVARMIHEARAAAPFGLSTAGDIDLAKVMAYVKERQDIIRAHENAEHFRALGMDVVLGEASFTSRDTVRVGDTVYRGKKIILATGSRPRELSIPGVEDTRSHLFTNETIFSLTTLPRRLVVIGAGPIGIELGQAFAFLGSEVHIVANESAILPREDADTAKVLAEQLARDGITFHFNATTLRFENGSNLIIQNTKTNTETALPFDAALVSIGRVLNTEGLGLDAAGITVEKGRIVVDAYLRTSNKHVLVCGDVAGQHQFTHVAELHAACIIRNLVTPFFKKKLSTDGMAWVTYTTPEIATYGLSTAELTKRGIPYTVLSSSFVEDDRAITDNAQDSHTKMYIHKRTKCILGGTMVAPSAGELVQELILAQSQGLGIDALFGKVYPYPTASRINKRLVAQEKKKSLTPLVQKLLRTLYRFAA